MCKVGENSEKLKKSHFNVRVPKVRRGITPKSSFPRHVSFSQSLWKKYQSHTCMRAQDNPEYCIFQMKHLLPKSIHTGTSSTMSKSEIGPQKCCTTTPRPPNTISGEFSVNIQPILLHHHVPSFVPLDEVLLMNPTFRWLQLDMPPNHGEIPLSKPLVRHVSVWEPSLRHDLTDVQTTS
jgi:hypothetical protein